MPEPKGHLEAAHVHLTPDDEQVIKKNIESSRSILSSIGTAAATSSASEPDPGASADESNWTAGGF
jgi:hypothetical protein